MLLIWVNAVHIRCMTYIYICVPTYSEGGVGGGLIISALHWSMMIVGAWCGGHHPHHHQHPCCCHLTCRMLCQITAGQVTSVLATILESDYRILPNKCTCLNKRTPNFWFSLAISQKLLSRSWRYFQHIILRYSGVHLTNFIEMG